MSKTLHGHRTKLNKTKQKQKRQNRRQSVVMGRYQLYCAVQSRSPDHCQTTTGKVQSSARDGTSSATVHSWQTTVHSWQTTAGCVSSGTLNTTYTIPTSVWCVRPMWYVQSGQMWYSRTVNREWICTGMCYCVDACVPESSRGWSFPVVDSVVQPSVSLGCRSE